MMRVGKVSISVLLLLFSGFLPSSRALRMDTKEIAPGVHMPVMSIGCGGLEKRNAYQIVSNWLKLGGRGIDTAFIYGNQDQVQRAIQHNRVDRSDLFITTKIPDCNASNVRKSVDADLGLLGMTHVDLMLIHSPRNGNCHAAWKILEEYYRSNQTRAIGVSNFGSADLESLLQKGTSIIPHVNQIKINLLHRDMETISYCANHGILPEAYSPLGRAGNNGIFRNAVVKQIAQAHNVSTYQIALKWVLQHGWMLTFQSSSQQHQATDAHVFHFSLTEDEMMRLDRIQDIYR